MDTSIDISGPEIDVTVAICTYNRAKMLRVALESLIFQKTGDLFTYEIVVVDDRSSDETPEVVKEIAAQAGVPVRYVREEGRGVAAARNRGIAEARGQWIAYTDDDQWNEPDWLYQLIVAARESDVDCIGGCVELELPLGAALPLTFVTSSILGQKRNREGQIKRLMDSPGTGSLMIRRTVFNKVGVFNDALLWGGEDAELMLRIHGAGIPVWFTPRSVVHHMIPPHRLTEDYFRWVSLRVGVALAEVDAGLRGRAMMLVLCAARIAQAVLVNLPRLIRAMIKGDRGRIVETKCLLWRAASYTRQALYTVAPRLFAQKHFFAGLKFRGERTGSAKSST